MRIITTIAAGALLASTTLASAGGLANEIVEAPEVDPVPVAAAPSINPTYIVIGVLAALLIAATVNDDDDDDDPAEEAEPPVVVTVTPAD